MESKSQHIMIMKVKTQHDIPAEWQVLTTRKKTTVRMRPCNGVEQFSVGWCESILTSDPMTDVIIMANGEEYPCERKIFNDTYAPVLELSSENADDVVYIKSATTKLVVIPIGETVQIETLEGLLKEVSFPDYIAIGITGELYANTFDFVRDNLEIL